MPEHYSVLVQRLREAQARTDAAREVYVAAMAAEAEARAPIKDLPAVLPGSASKDGITARQTGGWGAGNDPDVLVAELKTLIARVAEQNDHAAIYKAEWASQVEKQQSPDGIN